MDNETEVKTLDEVLKDNPELQTAPTVLVGYTQDKVEDPQVN